MTLKAGDSCFQLSAWRSVPRRKVIARFESVPCAPALDSRHHIFEFGAAAGDPGADTGGVTSGTSAFLTGSEISLACASS